MREALAIIGERSPAKRNIVNAVDRADKVAVRSQKMQGRHNKSTAARRRDSGELRLKYVRESNYVK